MFRKFSILLIALFVLIGICCKKKNTTQSPVPYQTVNITLYPNDPLNFKLQAIGGWKYIAGGVNGIIVYRKNNQNISSDFLALERTSTYLPNDPGALAKVRSDNFTCRDTVSNSEWKIIDGSVNHGPATLPLKQYNVTYDSGTDALHITN
jgi:hypothetical protein